MTSEPFSSGLHLDRARATAPWVGERHARHVGEVVAIVNREAGDRLECAHVKSAASNDSAVFTVVFPSVCSSDQTWMALRLIVFPVHET